MMKKIVLIATIGFFLFAANISAQIRSGASFLTMLPGARPQALSGTVTAGLDELHAIYANPGAAGFLRDWQWSATYTRWIADVYNASMILNTRIRTPWSSHTRLALGVLYQGIPDFDSSDKAAPMASANDVLVSASMGQPLTLLSKQISFGANVKYLRSTLAQYQASSLIFDAGIFYRTPKFRLLPDGLFKYGILSAGLSIINMGDGMTFISTKTPLPRTLRAGFAFYTGTHNGLQVQLSLDYFKIRDEDDHFGLGTEVSWNRLFAINAGYDFNRDLLNRATVGLSLSLDDLRMPTGAMFPGRNKAMRLDLATLDEEEFFSRTYRGGLSNYNIGPEAFRFLSPEMDAKLDSNRPTLQWEESRDPDLYDAVRYHLLLDADSTKLAEIVNEIKAGAMAVADIAQYNLMTSQQTQTNAFATPFLSGGDYYWAVICLDTDDHIRMAKTGDREIAHFSIPYPDLMVQDVQFDYDQWITTDDYQGILKITVANQGQSPARNVQVTVYDAPTAKATEPEKLAEQIIEQVLPGRDQQIEIEWHTAQTGLHRIKVVVDENKQIREEDEKNNVLAENFYTIPKGTFLTRDTSFVELASQVMLELPIINEVCMDTNSTVVKYPYLHRTVYDAPLQVIASRLRKYPHLRIFLQGFADPNSGETDRALAKARAEAVRDSMLQLGVAKNQMKIIGFQVLPLRRVPKNPLDAKRVFEERRFVRITAEGLAQNTLFAPVPHLDVEKIDKPVDFEAQLRYAVPIEKAGLRLLAADVSDSTSFTDHLHRNSFQGKVEWTVNIKDSARHALWLEKEADYSITLQDSLGRVFRTRPEKTFLAKGTFLREHRISFPLKFAKTDPLYSFYWDRIYKLSKKLFEDPNMRMRLEGHACAIGPKAVNERLSKRRARSFHQGFLRFIKEKHPRDYLQFSERMDPPEGYGESRPLKIVRLNGQVILIGDNNSPIGRKFNRRIEIVFYSTAKEPKITR